MKAIQRAWATARERLDGPHRWQKVTGPMSAMIATLRDPGWMPEEPTKWINPKGEEVSFVPGAPGSVYRLRREIRVQEIPRMRARAAEGHMGRGLEKRGGPDGHQQGKKEGPERGQPQVSGTHRHDRPRGRMAGRPKGTCQAGARVVRVLWMQTRHHNPPGLGV
jgi:hypothetical protein